MSLTQNKKSADLVSKEQKTERKASNNRGSQSTLISHNIVVDERRTSVRLEKEMWLGLKDIARREHCTIHDICNVIDQRKRENTSLTAAIRVFVMVYYQSAATDEGHMRAGHGTGPEIAGETIRRNLDTPYYGLRDFKHMPPDRLR